MKVLITTDWYKPVVNGVVTSITSLVDGLAELGHEVRILTLSKDRYSHRVGNLTYVGSLGIEKIYPQARLRTAQAGGYIRELINWRPDIVHSQCEFSTFFLAKKIAKKCGCPLIHTYHTVYEDFTHYFSPNVRLGKYMATVFSKKILEKVQAVIVPTVKIKDMLKTYGVQIPIAVVPSGLELEQFAAPANIEERNWKRASLGIAEADQVLIYLGRLAQEKQIEELLSFLAKQDNSQLRLLLVGDGPYRSQLEKQVKALHLSRHVIFTGMVPPLEVAQYYRLGDIFVSASQSETQGLTYIEAMASGLPLLCRADPCLDELIQEGFNGFIYHNEAEFSSRLKRLLADAAYRNSLGEEARKTVFRNFSAQGFATKVQEVYQEQLKQ